MPSEILLRELLRICNPLHIYLGGPKKKIFLKLYEKRIGGSGKPIGETNQKVIRGGVAIQVDTIQKWDPPE